MNIHASYQLYQLYIHALLYSYIHLLLDTRMICSVLKTFLTNKHNITYKYVLCSLQILVISDNNIIYN